MAIRPTQNDLMMKDIEAIRKDVAEIKDDLRNQYAPLHEVAALDMRLAHLEEDSVSRAEFWPIKTIVYGGVGFVLLGVLASILALIAIKAPT